MILAMDKLNDLMNKKNGTSRLVEDFRVRCIAHVVNVAIQNTFQVIQENIESVRSLNTAIRSSVKRRDLF